MLKLERASWRKAAKVAARYWGLVPAVLIALALFAKLHPKVYQFDYYISDEIWYATSSRNVLAKYLGVNVTVSYETTNESFAYPKHVSLDYCNLEHPPLPKYLIGLCYLLFGYWPWSWRYPSLVLSSALPLLAYFAARKLGGEAAGVVSSLFVYFDPMVNNMGFVAFLDVYLGFFALLTFVFVAYDKEKLSFIGEGLALSSKWNGVFFAPLLLLRDFKNGVPVAKSVARTAAFVFLVYLVINAPLLVVDGPLTWVNNHYHYIFSWHLREKAHMIIEEPGAKDWRQFICDPLGWMFNKNPWPLYYQKVNVTTESGSRVEYVLVKAEMLVPVSYAFWALVGLCLPLLRPRFWKKHYGVFLYFAFPLSFLGGHLLLWAIGTISQLSFYAFPLAVALDVAVPSVAVWCAAHYDELFQEWKSLLRWVLGKEAVVSQQVPLKA